MSGAQKVSGQGSRADELQFRNSWEGRYKATLQTALRLTGARPGGRDPRREATEQASNDLQVLSSLLNLAGQGDTSLDPHHMLCLADMVGRIDQRLALADELVDALEKLGALDGVEPQHSPQSSEPRTGVMILPPEDPEA